MGDGFIENEISYVTKSCDCKGLLPAMQRSFWSEEILFSNYIQYVAEETHHNISMCFAIKTVGAWELEWIFILSLYSIDPRKSCLILVEHLQGKCTFSAK
ncbi:Hypothetical predicted protein [Podarcis lilfordi]|uniref:Uncharacterized protein n=1 Tax=Podarcis lilfordi TaxID=74358 RepID=A0AA35NZY8_9SAUR|nr:Hypothetical predicted protein [Podarcis lilfordi]